jgi:hypothetical protein
MHVQIFGIGVCEQLLDGLFERPTNPPARKPASCPTIEGAHRQHAFAQLLGYFAYPIVGLIALADEDGEAHAIRRVDR